MGRPLAKRFFGNRNLGTTGTADNGIGGEGVDSAAVTVAGSFSTRPTFTFTDPTIPGGVTATGTITAQAKTGVVGGPITIAYINGEVVSGPGGTTWTVTKEAEQSVTIASTNNSGAGGTAQIVLTGPITAVKGANFLTASNISGCGLTTSTQYYIMTGGTGTTFAITDSYAKAVAGTPITLGSTGAATNGGVGIGSVYAPVASVTVADKGDFPATGGALSTAANATVSTTGSGDGLTVAINAYEGKAVVVTEKGSGYVTAPTVAGYANRGGITVATIVLTVDTGRQGGGGNATTNQENAIIVRAKTTSGGTVQIGDIQAQKGSHRYRVKTADGIAVCKLVATNSPLVNQAYMVATATGGTYYVTKLTAHRARLVTKTGDGALNGLTVKWTFGSPSATVVQIENA